MPTYIRLTDYKSSDEKEQEFFNPENRYEVRQEDFEKIPGSPIAYWVSDKVNTLFEDSPKLGEIAQPRQGVKTLNNDYFLKNWYEVDLYRIGFFFENLNDAIESQKKWFPYNKGGSFRKWYGNNEFIVNWENDGSEMKKFAVQQYNSITRTITNISYFFQEGLTWSTLSSDNLSVRYCKNGFIFDSKGSMMFLSSDKMLYMQSLLNSKMISQLLLAISPTLDFNAGALRQLPFLEVKNKNSINNIAQQNINISKEEWDSRETSWDFTKNELLKHKSDSKIETAYCNYCNYWKEQHNTLHQNEEELNRLFIDIYELQDELTSDVALEDITILKNEAKIENGELVFQADEIMKQFISYAVGVMLGRYSLDSDGLVVANLNQDYPKDTTFEIDDDNVIPVLDDEYFSDDIVSRFINFVKVTFGEENLSGNIKFIEESVGKDLRKYFVKEFYPDHIKRYKKRPIYWMVSSPKKGFMSLIYMHRYTLDLFGRVRNSYLTEYIAKLEAHKETLTLTTQSSTASNKDKKDADKQIKNIDAKLKEIIAFDRDVMMRYAQDGVEIDLDDGVKVNYCKFKDILYEFDKKLCK